MVQFRIEKFKGENVLLFVDNTGMSFLAKSKSLAFLKKRKIAFMKKYRAGHLLRTDKSVLR